VSEPAPPPSVAPRRRPLGWALIASLALNLFFVGLIGSTLWRWHDRRDMASGFAGAGWMMPMLPEELRKQLRERMQEHRLDLRERGLEVRQARLAVIRALAAEPYDRAAADRAFADLRQKLARVQEVMHGTIVAAGADLTSEQRKALIDRLPVNP
jgi:uncharacterized membrane protein